MRLFPADTLGTSLHYARLIAVGAKSQGKGDLRQPFYNGLTFHRVMAGFMIQGGCPNTKDGEGGMPGTGGPGYQIKAEFNDVHHEKGILSMARSQDPNSAGSQFFVCHGDAGFLDNQYTAFGRLVDGDDTLEKIASAPVTASRGGEKSSPVNPVKVTKVTIDRGA